MTKPCAADCTDSCCADVVLLNADPPCECQDCECGNPLVELKRPLRHG